LVRVGGIRIAFFVRMPEEDHQPTARPRRSRSAALVLSLLVLVAAGIWFWTNRSGEPAQANGADPVHSILHLETFVLNLADSDQRSYLRVGIDLALNQDAKRAEETVPIAEVRDTILSVLGEAKVSDLLQPGGKTELKHQVLHALQDRVPALGVEEVYASAQVDQRKVGKLALAIQVAFQELGVFPASTTKIPFDANEPMPFSTVQVIQNARHNTELGRIASPPQDSLTAASEEANLTTLQAELQQALRQEIASHAVALHRETEGLVISLREFGFFDSGSAAWRPSAMPALDRIASILAIRTCRLRIEGHTDNIPIHTAQMASNWELSTARSTELVRLLIVRYRFSPERLSAAGYAEYHPIASNDTAQGRAQNRRVDIVILSEHIVRKDVVAEASSAKPSPAIP
jgi:chemotaxis protein MotB